MSGIVEETLRTSDGFPLFCRRCVPAGAVAAVFFLHGMSEHSGMYRHVIQALGGAGFAVLAPDQRGRGRSVDGRWRRGDLHAAARVLADLDELRAARAADLDGLPVFVVAVSMGAIIAQRWALERQDGLAGMVLVGPPFGAPAGTSPGMAALSGLLAAAAPRLPLRPAPAVSDISRERGFQDEMEADPHCYHGPLRARAARELLASLLLIERRVGELRLPLLVQYGTGDRIVSAREVQELHRRWAGADKTLTVLDGLYHDVLNEPERMKALGEITGWIGARARR
jgi:acylglycerol lipase